MHSQSVRVYVPLTIALILAASPADAAEDNNSSGIQSTLIGQHDLRLEIGPGLFESSGKDAGVLLAGHALLQWGVLEVGLAGHAGGAALDYNVFGGGLLAGLGASTPWGLRGDILGEVGVEHYSGVDHDWLFGTDPGATANLGYAGLRTGLSYRFAPRAHPHLEIGLWAIFQDDLARSDVRYTYVVQSGDGAPLATSSEHTVGTSRLSLVLSVGGSLSL